MIKRYFFSSASIVIFLRGGTIHRQNRVVLMGLLFLLTGVVLVALSGTAIGDQKVETNKAVKTEGSVSNKKVNEAKTMPKGPSEMRMPDYRIRVQVNGDRRLEGRKVTIRLRKGRANQTRTLSLNSSGDAEHRFNLGSVAPAVEGNWTVTVEKGPEDSRNYYSTANICFEGTDPANHIMTLDRSHRSVTVAFTINYVIAWDRQGICW